MMFLWNTAILILSELTFGCSLKRATARPPAGSGPQGTAIAVAGLAFLGFAFLQNKISFNCRE